MKNKTNVVGMTLLTVCGTIDVEASYTYVIEKETIKKVINVTDITHQGQTMHFYDSIAEDIIDEVQYWVDRGQ